MRGSVVFVLCITTSLADVEHVPRGNVQPEPRDVIDVGTLRSNPAIAKERKSRQVDPLACGSTDVLNIGEYAVVQSPGYPYRRYPNNFNCTWELVIPAGSEALLSCDYFYVKKGDYFILGENQYYGYSSGFGGYQVELLDTVTSIKLGLTTNRRGRAWGFRCYIDIEGGDFTTTTTTTPVPPPLITTTATTGSNSSSTCSCGIPNKSDRIVGGQETEANEYPWQVALVSASGSHPFCGGTLISAQHVLTAAHCTGGGAANIAVLVGEHRIDDNSFTRLSVKTITDHPDYNSNTLDQDFSILTLSEPVTFTKEISPACLPADSSETYEGKKATVSGWGTTSSGGNQPTTLREVEVSVQSQADCNTAYGGSITSNMICAADSGKDSCQGDSGGPMVVQENDRYALVGVVSWGFGCADPKYPGVYARVTSQMAWITSVTASSPPELTNC